MTRHSRRWSPTIIEFLRFNRNASEHTALAYAGDLTQFIDYVATLAKAGPSDAHRRRSDHRRDPHVPRRAVPLGSLSRHGRAQTRRRQELRALPAPGRRDRRRSRRACRHAATRAEAARASLDGRDVDAARDARSLVSARAARPGDPGVVLRLRHPLERARRPRSRRGQPLRADRPRTGQGRERTAGTHQHERGFSDPRLLAGSGRTRPRDARTRPCG